MMYVSRFNHRIPEVGKQIFTSEDFEVYRFNDYILLMMLTVFFNIKTIKYTIYRTVKNKIKQKIAHEFKLIESKLYLTHPTFFSEMTSKEAKTSHDEYWHVHVDKVSSNFFILLLHLLYYLC